MFLKSPKVWQPVLSALAFWLRHGLGPTFSQASAALASGSACLSKYHQFTWAFSPPGHLSPLTVLSPAPSQPPLRRPFASQAANFRRWKQHTSSWTGPQRGSNAASSSPVPVHACSFLSFPLCSKRWHYLWKQQHLLFPEAGSTVWSQEGFVRW